MHPSIDPGEVSHELEATKFTTFTTLKALSLKHDRRFFTSKMSLPATTQTATILTIFSHENRLPARKEAHRNVPGDGRSAILKTCRSPAYRSRECIKGAGSHRGREISEKRTRRQCQVWQSQR